MSVNQLRRSSSNPGSAEFNNEKIFHLFGKKLSEGDLATYRAVATRLSTWLDSEKAYYPAARPRIIELLETAEGRLYALIQGRPDSIDLLAHPAALRDWAETYLSILRVVRRYTRLFSEPELRARLDGLMHRIARAEGQLSSSTVNLVSSPEIEIVSLPNKEEVSESAHHVAPVPPSIVRPPRPERTRQEKQPEIQSEGRVPSQVLPEGDDGEILYLGTSSLDTSGTASTLLPATNPSLSTGSLPTKSRPRKKRKTTGLSVDLLTLDLDYAAAKKKVATDVAEEPLPAFAAPVLLLPETHSTGVSTTAHQDCPPALLAAHGLAESGESDIATGESARPQGDTFAQHNQIARESDTAHASGSLPLHFDLPSSADQILPMASSAAVVDVHTPYEQLSKDIVQESCATGPTVDLSDIRDVAGLEPSSTSATPSSEKLFDKGATEALEILPSSLSGSTDQAELPLVGGHSATDHAHLEGPTRHDLSWRSTTDYADPPAQETPSTDKDTSMSVAIPQTTLSRDAPQTLLLTGPSTPSSEHVDPSTANAMNVNVETSQGPQINSPFVMSALGGDNDLAEEETKTFVEPMHDLPEVKNQPGALSTGGHVMPDITGNENHPGHSHATHVQRRPLSPSVNLRPSLTRKTTSSGINEEASADDLVGAFERDAVDSKLGPEAVILTAQRCMTEAANIVLQFDISTQQSTLLERWVYRRKDIQTDLSTTLCFSLACYRTADLLKEAQQTASVDISKPLSDRLQSQWPSNGLLSLEASFQGSVATYPLSPPSLYLFPGNYVDISQFLQSGNNILRLQQFGSLEEYTIILRAHHPTRAQLAMALSLRKKELDRINWKKCFLDSFPGYLDFDALERRAAANLEAKIRQTRQDMKVSPGVF